MRIELPGIWILTLNIVGWPMIHFGFAWAFGRIPQERFNQRSWIFRSHQWEYILFGSIRRWKHLLPDAAPWLGGFPKKYLKGKDLDYLTHFARETCRAELSHWAMMFAVIVFFIWNPLWADGVMVIYAIVANLPCILAQRFNRIRLMRAIASIKANVD